MRLILSAVLVGMFAVCSAVSGDEEVKKAPPKAAKQKARPMPEGHGKALIREEPIVFGIEVYPEIVRTPADVRAESAKKKGIKVTGVVPGSTAERAGIKAGDIVYELNGRELQSFNDLIDAIGDLRPGEKTFVRLLRRRDTVINQFTLDASFVKIGDVFPFWHEHKNKFVSRAWLLGLVAVSKETANGSCKWSSFCGPLLFDYVKIGDREKVTSLLLLTTKWGDKKPLVL